MTKRQEKRGGYRKGSGRPAKHGERMRGYQILLPPRVVAKLDDLASEQHKSRSGLILELLAIADSTIRATIRELEEESMNILNIFGSPQRLDQIQKIASKMMPTVTVENSNNFQLLVTRILSREKDHLRVSVTDNLCELAKSGQLDCKVTRVDSTISKDAVIVELIKQRGPA